MHWPGKWKNYAIMKKNSLLGFAPGKKKQNFDITIVENFLLKVKVK